MRTKTSLGIAMLACIILTSCDEIRSNRSGFYGEWAKETIDGFNPYDYGGLTISADSVIVSYSSKNEVMLKCVILEWEAIQNKNKNSDASYPDGYAIKTENANGEPGVFNVLRHSKDKNRIRVKVPWLKAYQDLHKEK